MKKFINRPENAVEEMLEGLAVLSPGLARLGGHKVLVRADADWIRDKQVAVISGGGSGHEPAHAGYVGQGMLSAGIAGKCSRHRIRCTQRSRRWPASPGRCWWLRITPATV